MGTELTTKVMLRQTLVLMEITFLNNVRKVGRLVLSRTSCSLCAFRCALITYLLYALKYVHRYESNKKLDFRKTTELFTLTVATYLYN
jgi:hypothetical protein